MDTHDLLFLIGGVCALVGLFFALLSLKTKLQAREHLVAILRNDSMFVRRASDVTLSQDLELSGRELEELEEIIRRHLQDLNEKDRKEVELPLAQPSSFGRSRYVRSLVERAHA